MGVHQQQTAVGGAVTRKPTVLTPPPAVQPISSAGRSAMEPLSPLWARSRAGSGPVADRQDEFHRGSRTRRTADHQCAAERLDPVDKADQPGTAGRTRPAATVILYPDL